MNNSGAGLSFKEIQPIKIANKSVGYGSPVLIIAEAGVNHNGSFSRAKHLIEAAAQAGVDVIKFQTFNTDLLVSSVDQEFYNRLKGKELTIEQFYELKELANKLGLIFMSTPHEEKSADFLFEMGVPAFKIGSGELNNLSFLKHISKKGLPIILSTGMSDEQEIDNAVKLIASNGNTDLILLHCTTAYPTPMEDNRLRLISVLKQKYQIPIGFSDHSIGNEIPVAAVAAGADVIEKHLTIDKSLSGQDHIVSADPKELKDLVKQIKTIEKAMGSIDLARKPTASELKSRLWARKSLVAANFMKAGTILNPSHIVIKRPGTGIGQENRDLVIGKKIRRDLDANSVITWDDLENDK